MNQVYLLLILSIVAINRAKTSKSSDLYECYVNSKERGILMFWEYTVNVTFVCGDKNCEDILFVNDAVCRNDDMDSKDKVISINFEDCELSWLPHNIYETYPNIKTFDISHLQLESLKTTTFLKATELVNLRGSHNQIAEIPSNLFENSNKMIELDLSFNKIGEFVSDIFSSSNQLEYLNLNHNKISGLNVKSFQRLTNLKQLQFSHNQVVEIPSLLFLKTRNLTEIDFSWNKIERINDFAFGSDFKVTKLDLSNNQLVALNGKLLRNLESLTYLDVSGNHVQNIKTDTFEKLQNLMHLDLSNNPLVKLPTKLFANLVNLQHLNLSRTSLTQIEIGTFFSQKNVHILDLSENHLKVLAANIFAPQMNQLNWLMIGNNQLQDINGLTSASIPNGKIVGIDSNRFNCSYLTELLFELQSIKWGQLHGISKEINCSTNNADENGQTLTISSIDMSGCKNGKAAFKFSAEKNAEEKDSTNEFILLTNQLQTKIKSAKKEKFDEATNHKYLIDKDPSELSSIKSHFHAWLWFFAIAFSLIGGTLVWMFIRSRRRTRIQV